MVEVTVGGFGYRTRKLDAFAQFHVARRVAPVLSTMTVAARGGNMAPVELMSAVADAVGRLTQEDADYVLKTCLSACDRQVAEGAYAPVVVSGGLMFRDIELPEMIELVMAVVQENLLRFFPESLSSFVPSPLPRASTG